MNWKLLIHPRMKYKTRKCYKKMFIMYEAYHNEGSTYPDLYYSTHYPNFDVNIDIFKSPENIKILNEKKFFRKKINKNKF